MKKAAMAKPKLPIMVRKGEALALTIIVRMGGSPTLTITQQR